MNSETKIAIVKVVTYVTAVSIGKYILTRKSEKHFKKKFDEEMAKFEEAKRKAQEPQIIYVEL